MKANTDGKPVIIELRSVPMLTDEQFRIQLKRGEEEARHLRAFSDSEDNEKTRLARLAVVKNMREDCARLNTLARLDIMADEAFTVAFESMRDTYRHSMRDGHEPGDFWTMVRGAMHKTEEPGEQLKALLDLSVSALDDRAFAFAMEGMHAAADNAVRTHYSRDNAPPPPSFAAILRPALRSA